MTAVIVALPEPAASAIAADLEEEGASVIQTCAPGAVDAALLDHADALLLPASRAAITHALVGECDRARVRIVTIGGEDPRFPARLGLAAPLPSTASAAEILAAIARRVPHEEQSPPEAAPQVFAVWGPHGAPGRSTVAIQLAAARARTGRHVALVDADTHAPSLSLLLALGDDAPGIAAACRRAELGGLDAAELSRLAVSVPLDGGGIEVLGGLNRPSRWPELSAGRLRETLRVCRSWAQDTIVDIGAAWESDEEVSFDVETPRRNAATLTALQEADAVIALASAEPLGIARFLHGYSELRALIGATPIVVAVNRVRPGPVGIDARGQIRRTLERFAGIRDVHFLPEDRRAADTALLHSRPMIELTPRAPLVGALRRLADALPHGAPADEDSPGPMRRRLLARR